jgi:hypothetical protein
MPHRVLAIVTDSLHDTEPIEEVSHGAGGDGLEVRVVVPAVEANPLRHAFGDVDEPREQAQQRLAETMEALRSSGLEVSGEVGDPDPIQAAQDALLKAPADEVLIFEHEQGQARWFEDGLFERARASLQPPLRMVVLHGGDGDGDHVVEVERAGAGISLDDEAEIDVPISHNMPQVPRGDLVGMVIGVVGTIVVILLAAAGPGPDSGWGAASILIAMAIAIVNMAHVVGLIFFDSVRYRGGWEKFFRGLALVGTPAAVAINLLILLFA